MGMTAELNQGMARRRTLLARGALIAACGIAAAACGSTVAPSGVAHGGGTSSAATTSAAKVSLSVALTTGGSDAAAKHWTLRCEPTGGNFPDAAAACSKLLKLPMIFSPPSHHVMCPMIMADARMFIVHGTFLGKKVHQSIVDGGCDLSRWAELNKVFG